MNGEYNLDLKEGVNFQVRRGHWLPEKLGVEYVAFGKTLYCQKVDGKVPKHEFLHIAQFSRFGVTRVLLHYLFHIVRNYCRYRDFALAFRLVPFEVEAENYEAGRFPMIDQGCLDASDK